MYYIYNIYVVIIYNIKLRSTMSDSDDSTQRISRFSSGNNNKRHRSSNHSSAVVNDNSSNNDIDILVDEYIERLVNVNRDEDNEDIIEIDQGSRPYCNIEKSYVPIAKGATSIVHIYIKALVPGGVYGPYNVEIGMCNV